MSERQKRNALSIAKSELRKEKREKFILMFFLGISLVSTLFVLVFLSSKLITTGYSVYLDSKAGYITTVHIPIKFNTYYWTGIYGLALRVPGYSQQLSLDANGGEIVEKPLYFNCMQEDAIGGREVYASTSSVIDFDSLEPATAEQVNAFMGCTAAAECADNTFLNTMNIMVGTRNISGIPSTFTYKYNGENEIFKLGVLNDSENLVFVTNLNETYQKGYSQNVTVNYQMILPTPFNGTVKYYFFTDPYDVCPEGGIGNNIEASISGYVKNSVGSAISNVDVNVAGYIGTTDQNGFYNFSFIVVAGDYNLVATKTGYDTYVSNVSVDFSNYVLKKNITMVLETPYSEENEGITPFVYGFVRDEVGNNLSGVNVSLGSSSYLTNSSGYYELSSSLTSGVYPLIAFKTGYNNNFTFILFNSSSVYNYNITLFLAEQYTYATGPYETGPYTSNEQARKAAEEAKVRGEDFWISTKEIIKEVRQNTFVEDVLGFYNFQSSNLNIVLSVSPSLEGIVELDKNSYTIAGNTFVDVLVTFYGVKPIGEYKGVLYVSGDIEKEIPVTVNIVERKFSIETLLMELDLLESVVQPGDSLHYKLSLQNLLRNQPYKVEIKTSITDYNGTVLQTFDEKDLELDSFLSYLDSVPINESFSDGDYLLKVDAKYLNLISSVTSQFRISRPIYFYAVFGVPLWMFFVAISVFSFLFLNFFLYRRYKEKKKRYKVSLDVSTLPRAGDNVAKLGLLAEKNIPAYYELSKLTTHGIIAGATGMGKSISAQVLVEECLLNNVGVLVFDPTAQWSGMLRKCTDKRMLSFYPKFGLKEGDAKAFKGNVRQVKNERELIDINKYINPGQIQIFSLNKLDPSKIDIFVANIIRQIFKSDPKESPDLKVVLVFDEVHRLLSKFGGSGEGFLQIERACREFRKWGIGVLLISQVLSDFVGEIKANINTEVQTRTIEESDLERIKTKYGEEFLKSLVRAEVGVAMFQNADYNRGKPYFINFRPILHNTRRLSDEELEKYNKYNETVDDLEYSIEQLEAEKVDTFDLKMELKLVKDKVMTGNFSVVEIYLEGLKPRIDKEWERLGKKPKKREVQLVEESEIKKSIEEAKKSREKFQKEEEKNKPKEEVKEKKEDISVKEVKALTFDNGLMISSLKELLSVLENLDDEIFAIHVNAKKNDIAAWIAENFDKTFGEGLKSVVDKAKLIDALSKFAKGGIPERKEKSEVSSGKKGGEKKEEPGKAQVEKKVEKKEGEKAKVKEEKKKVKKEEKKEEEEKKPEEKKPAEKEVEAKKPDEKKVKKLPLKEAGKKEKESVKKVSEKKKEVNKRLKASKKLE
jgi:hypothetical protein